MRSERPPPEPKPPRPPGPLPASYGSAEERALQLERSSRPARPHKPDHFWAAADYLDTHRTLWEHKERGFVMESIRSIMAYNKMCHRDGPAKSLLEKWWYKGAILEEFEEPVTLLRAAEAIRNGHVPLYRRELVAEVEPREADIYARIYEKLGRMVDNCETPEELQLVQGRLEELRRKLRLDVRLAQFSPARLDEKTAIYVLGKLLDAHPNLVQYLKRLMAHIKKAEDEKWEAAQPSS